MKLWKNRPLIEHGSIIIGEKSPRSKVLMEKKVRQMTHFQITYNVINPYEFKIDNINHQQQVVSDYVCHSIISQNEIESRKISTQESGSKQMLWKISEETISHFRSRSKWMNIDLCRIISPQRHEEILTNHRKLWAC